jgi:molecular chaperone Hsp33
MIADFRTGGGVRAQANFDAARVEQARGAAGAGAVGDVGLLGHGHLALTVDQGAASDRYQGVVGLEGGNLSQTVRRYFRQSEQIRAEIRAGASRGADGVWQAGCLMVQHLPKAGRQGLDGEDTDDAWNEARLMAATVRPEELTDPDLSAHDLLGQLFNGLSLRVYQPRPVRFDCNCSRARAQTMLEAMTDDQRADFNVDGHILVTCHFCNSSYDFFADQIGSADSPFRPDRQTQTDA